MGLADDFNIMDEEVRIQRAYEEWLKRQAAKAPDDNDHSSAANRHRRRVEQKQGELAESRVRSSQAHARVIKSRQDNSGCGCSLGLILLPLRILLVLFRQLKR